MDEVRRYNQLLNARFRTQLMEMREQQRALNSFKEDQEMSLALARKQLQLQMHQRQSLNQIITQTRPNMVRQDYVYGTPYVFK